MPAPAVIPAPIAYIKVVAVKKLVVGFRGCSDLHPAHRVGLLTGYFFNIPDLASLPLIGWGSGSGSFTLKKLGCLKQAIIMP